MRRLLARRRTIMSDDAPTQMQEERDKQYVHHHRADVEPVMVDEDDDRLRNRDQASHHSGPGQDAGTVHPQIVTHLNADLEAAIRDALPAGCEASYASGRLCERPPAWSITYHCDCPDNDSALVCTGHIHWARTTDFACTDCGAPLTIIAVRRL